MRHGIGLDGTSFLLRNWHSGIQKLAKIRKFGQNSEFRCRVNCPKSGEQVSTRSGGDLHGQLRTRTGQSCQPRGGMQGCPCLVGEGQSAHSSTTRLFSSASAGIGGPPCGHTRAHVGTRRYTWAPMNTRGCPCGCSGGTGGYMWPLGWVKTPVMPLFLGFVGPRGAPCVPASPRGAP
jgi:hypothetical protein